MDLTLMIDFLRSPLMRMMRAAAFAPCACPHARNQLFSLQPLSGRLVYDYTSFKGEFQNKITLHIFKRLIIPQRCHSSFIQRNSYIFNTCLNKKKHHRSIHNIRLQMIIDNQVFEFSNTCTVGEVFVLWRCRPTWIGSQPWASDPSPPAVSIESGRCGCRLSGRNYRLNAGRMAHAVLPPLSPL